jgi:hypothetical protein
MKRLIIAVILAVFVAINITPVNAAEQLLTAKISSVTIAKDKNGAEYVRMLIDEQRNIGGIQYTKTVPVVAFRENVAAAKALKQGDTLKAVVSKSSLPDGRESYRIVGFAAQAQPVKK